MNIKINNNTSFSFLDWMGLHIEDFLAKAEANGIVSQNIFSIEFTGGEIEIPWGAFFEKFTNLKSVTISGSERVRLNCYNFDKSTIENVYISAPEIWFNDGVFFNAPMLRRVTIHGKIIDGQHGGFSEMTFRNCEKLEYVDGCYHGSKVMPSVFENCKALFHPMDFYVTYLGSGTFAYCRSLKHIHLHNGLINMGWSSFEGCVSLEDVYIPDTVRDMGYNTFKGCSSLKKVHIPNNISKIGASVFEDCISLGQVFLPDSLIQIERCAFKNCISLQRPWMPNGLLTIGEQAFAGCSAIKELWIPQSVTSIGKDAFAGCLDLIIRGKSGSTAEIFANENGIVFLPD